MMGPEGYPVPKTAKSWLQTPAPTTPPPPPPTTTTTPEVWNHHKSDLEGTFDSESTIFSDDTSTKKKSQFFLEFVLYPILAGILMHGTGLKVKFAYEEWPEYMESLAGAAVEGAFLLLLATRVYLAGHCIYSYLASACASSGSRASRLKRNIVLKVFLAGSLILSASFFGFILSAIIGDATFRIMSGNDSPSAEVIQAGFGNAKSNAMSQIQHEPFGVLFRLCFSLLCIGGSVGVYHVRVVRSWWTKKRKATKGSTDNPNTVNLAPVPASGADLECDLIGTIVGGANTPTSGSKGDSKGARLSKSKVLQVYVVGMILAGAACYMNSADWYTPVIFAYFSVYFNSDDVLGDSAFEDSVAKASAANAAFMANRPMPSATNLPNVIYLQHESLSGSIMFNTDEGIKATPWFNQMKKEDPNFYAFEGGRTVSGITIDAMPALMTGCAPYSKKGTDWVHTKGRAIGYDFFNKGYRTASFTSRALDKTIKTGQWSMLYDLLVGAMEYVVDPIKMNWKFDNSEGSDDRRMLPKFEKWLEKSQGNSTTGGDHSPFYAQFYNFNQHYPYLKDPKRKESFSHRVYDSLATTDEFLQRLFEILEKAGRLENTIIVGSGDHGEDPFKDTYVRLSALNSNVLHAAHYMYYPRHLMPDPSIAERLRMNTQKMTHTLDMYPTIQSILHGGPYDYLQHADQDCITGIDLTSVVIPDDRVVISWNLVSSQIVKKLPAEFWALSTRDSEGKDWSLYHRLSRNRHPGLKQGKNNFYMLEYGDCTHDINPKNLCMMNMKERHRELFRGAIQWIKHTPLLGEGVKDSKLIKLFAEEVGWKETGEVPVVAALPQPLEPVATADESIQSDEVDEKEPTSKGFVSSVISVRNSFQELIGKRSDDPSCDDILMFMPNTLEPIAKQINGYIRAAMMATFANKALVVLDMPHDAICADEKDPKNLGLYDVLERPKEWLSRGCRVPCATTHSYADWNEIRQGMSQMVEPVEHVCSNDNGRETRVFPIGGDNVHDFFETNFNERMLQRPSPFAYDWAVRLGASEPHEAELFTQLQGEVMWDYVGVLLVRSGILLMNEDVVADVSKYFKKIKMPTPKNFDGAIDFPRGNDVLNDPAAKSFKLEHYLKHYYDNQKKACNRKQKQIYISTDDPKKAFQEVKAFGANGKLRFTVSKCLSFRFVVGLAGSARKRNSKDFTGSCAARYGDIVKDIGDYMIMRKATTFMGEIHTDLGRLARTDRLILNPKETTDFSKLVISDTKTQGNIHPGPPGW